jgi:peroxiredoxin
MSHIVRRAVIAAFALATVASAAWVTLRPSSAPEATFTTIQGELVPTASLRGKVVLVNFWATDCDICVKEMPRLVQTYVKFRGRGLEAVAVAMPYDPPSHVIAYAQREALPFRVAIDPYGETAKSFGDVRLTPTTFVLDREGSVLKRYVGDPDFAELERVIDRALEKTS